MSKTKLNLGAGNDIYKPDEYYQHDLIKHRPEIELMEDLNCEKWYEMGMNYEEIRAFDVIEHLDNPINFMNNCWNLLMKGGILDIKACGWQNPNYWVDITHKHPFDIRSFDYFDFSTELGKQYSYYTFKKWKILEIKYDKHKNILAKLTPIK